MELTEVLFYVILLIARQSKSYGIKKIAPNGGK